MRTASCAFSSSLGGEVLRHARLQVAALAAVVDLGGVAHEQARRLHAGPHLAELQLDRLVLADRLAEGVALARVLQRLVEGRRRDAHAARRDVDPPELEAAHRLVEAAPFLPDQIRGRHAVVVEDELCRVDALVAELLELLARREARALLAEQHRHAAVTGLGRGIRLQQDGEAMALDAVGDPGLRAVDDEMVAFTARAGADRLQVGAGVRLGQRETAAQLAGGEPRKIRRLELRTAVALDEQRHHQVRVEDAGERHPCFGDPRDDPRIQLRREAEAAVLGADRRAEQAQLAHALDHLRRPDVVVLELHDLRLDLADEPAVDRVQDLRCFRRVGGDAGSHLSGQLYNAAR
jgi:hypothetical protein